MLRAVRRSRTAPVISVPPRSALRGRPDARCGEQRRSTIRSVTGLVHNDPGVGCSAEPYVTTDHAQPSVGRGCSLLLARGGAARRPGGQSAESDGRRRREASAVTGLVAAPFRRSSSAADDRGGRLLAVESTWNAELPARPVLVESGCRACTRRVMSSRVARTFRSDGRVGGRVLAGRDPGRGQGRPRALPRNPREIGAVTG
jgi:hypothetical protein